MIALQRVEVNNNLEGEDGFQLRLVVSKLRQGELNLLRTGVLDPDTRVLVGVILGARLYPLMDGVIYHEQLTPDNASGTFQLSVMGRSIAVMLDLEQRVDRYLNQSSSDIVRNIISTRYAKFGMVGGGDITATNDRDSDKVRITSQNGTDRQFIGELARRNGFCFYIEPATLGTTNVYWGPEDRKTAPLSPLLVELGSATNVTDIHFSHDPLAPIRVEGDTIVPGTKKSQKVQAPVPTPGVSIARPTAARRTVRLRCAARLGPSDARTAAGAMQARAPEPVTAEGSLDTVRYGDVLRVHRVITVRGAGRSYDGDYMIEQVTHEIEVGKYNQGFTLRRKGLEAPK